MASSADASRRGPLLAAFGLVLTALVGCGGGGPAALAGRASTTTAVPARGPEGGGPVGGRDPGTALPTDTVASAGLGVVVTPSGVVAPVVARRGAGWLVETPCGAERVVRKATPVARTTIVLDPGHGGAESGARAPDGLAEATVNLDVARRAQAALEAAGVAVVLTRTDDYDMSLRSRAQVAVDLAPRAFVSIHHNAVPDGPRSDPGTETYYQRSSPDSRRLAGLVYEEVVRALAAYRVAWVGDRDAGAKYRPGSRGDYYAVLRQPAGVVSVLAELAFVTNPPEAELLARPEVRQREADAVARGVVRWLRTDDPGSGYVEPYPRPPEAGSPGPPACKDPAF
jgi:N-acetylmuramoyl-L-alanine amidase